KAAEKIYSDLGRLRKIRRDRAADGKRTMIGVAGCVAQAEGEEILARAPMVDLVFGPQSYHLLPELVIRAESGPVVATDFPAEDKFEHLPAPSRATIIARGVAAFLTVQEGCDKFCSFCVVPYTRGAEFSRPLAQIVEEARRLAEAGVREITLLGQNVNAWHGFDAAGRPIGLGALIRHLAGIPSLARLRYTTSHPRDMDDELIAAHVDLDKLMPWLHLPVQSGSDAVLKAMNRRHTIADYLATLKKIRAARPDIALSGDFIVGFPGETDADFRATLALVDKVGYASAFSFKYSPRPGTPGAEMQDQIPEAVKSERLIELQDLIEAHRARFNRSMAGGTLPVLLERRAREPGQLSGRSPYLQTVLVDASPEMLGEIVPVHIHTVGTNSLFGEIVTQRAAAE
ncbi:MAG: tRNA (N6-isopentenyl adenosine(37)-C2)-methylthiotransferase MiaB, partial [Cucumibacter sp.]